MAHDMPARYRWYACSNRSAFFRNPSWTCSVPSRIATKQKDSTQKVYTVSVPTQYASYLSTREQVILGVESDTLIQPEFATQVSRGPRKSLTQPPCKLQLSSPTAFPNRDFHKCATRIPSGFGSRWPRGRDGRCWTLVHPPVLAPAPPPVAQRRFTVHPILPRA